MVDALQKVSGIALISLALFLVTLSDSEQCFFVAFLLPFSHMNSYLCKIRVPGYLNKTIMHENVSKASQGEKTTTSLTTRLYWLVPSAKPKDGMCQRTDHKEGMFKGKLGEGKNANPAQIACMPQQAELREGLRCQLGAHLGHIQGSPKSPKLIMASAKPDSRDAFKLSATGCLNCSFN